MEISIINQINSFVFNNDLKTKDLNELCELVLDFLLDNDIVDLSDDEDGDKYMLLSNNVYEYLESILN
jgi:hypothetical protein